MRCFGAVRASEYACVCWKMENETLPLHVLLCRCAISWWKASEYSAEHDKTQSKMEEGRICDGYDNLRSSNQVSSFAFAFIGYHPYQPRYKILCLLMMQVIIGQQSKPNSIFVINTGQAVAFTSISKALHDPSQMLMSTLGSAKGERGE